MMRGDPEWLWKQYTDGLNAYYRKHMVARKSESVIDIAKHIVLDIGDPPEQIVVERTYSPIILGEGRYHGFAPSSFLPLWATQVGVAHRVLDRIGEIGPIGTRYLIEQMNKEVKK